MITQNSLTVQQEQRHSRDGDEAQYKWRLLSHAVYALFGLGFLYAVLVGGVSPAGGAAICLALAGVYSLRPRHALVLLTPGLIPAGNIDLGIGITPIPVITAAALLRLLADKVVMRDDRVSSGIPRLALWGWACMFAAFACSSMLAGRFRWAEVAAWAARCALMVLYSSACTRRRILDYALIGWSIAGVLAVGAAAFVLATTGSALAFYGGLLPPSGQGALLGVVSAVLAPSFFVTVSIWSLFALKSRRLLSSGAVMLGAVLMVLPLIITGRRQGILGIALSIIMYCYATRGRAALPVVLAVSASTALLLQTGLLQQVREGRPSLKAELQDEGTGRMALYETGLKAFVQRPVLGWGPGAYRDLTVRSGASEEGTSGHNSFIQLAAEAGIVGLAGALLVFAGVVRAAVSLIRHTFHNPHKHWVFIVPISGFVMAGAMVSDLFIVPYLLAMSLLCGASAAAQRDTAFSRD